MEAGESLGYLPGDLNEKMAPYLRPLYDALGDRLGGRKVRQYIDDGTIEIAPVGFMRGRTLNNSFVVIDEAQNCTYGQLKMLLSRLGWHSTMVVTGDRSGVKRVHILNGFHKDVLREEIYTSSGAGTMIVRRREKERYEAEEISKGEDR